MVKSHDAVNCACSTDPEECPCRCRSCGQKRGRAETRRLRREVRCEDLMNPEKWTERRRRATRMNQQSWQTFHVCELNGWDHETVDAVGVTAHEWGWAIGAPDYGRWDVILSKN